VGARQCGFERGSVVSFSSPAASLIERNEAPVVQIATHQDSGRCADSRAENSHLLFRRRERAMLCFRRLRSLQKSASVHASVSDHFNQDRGHSKRDHVKANRAAARARKFRARD